MGADEVRQLLKKQPFAPIALSLSDGRSVEVRHPDQVVVTRRHVFVGLAHVKKEARRLATPSDDSVAMESLFIDLAHIVSVEPSNGGGAET